MRNGAKGPLLNYSAYSICIADVGQNAVPTQTYNNRIDYKIKAKRSSDDSASQSSTAKSMTSENNFQKIEITLDS